MLLQESKKKDEKQTDTVLVESLRLIMASSGLLLNLINNLLDVKKVNSESKNCFDLCVCVCVCVCVCIDLFIIGLLFLQKMNFFLRNRMHVLSGLYRIVILTYICL
jgi:hypothetical protein